ncbi:mRNA-decapping enzyme-like protein isoform X3 [Arachis ipaensis]|uniref:mRNA-decapping enzyme-like protein isoform X3 n=1 Tax=Arachis ipaensis TaxID=130454 RepID=UPI000A2B81A4|nr:mRNA-decapping enzyme-like protein isoform X3 [Arachis ipaensis]
MSQNGKLMPNLDQHSTKLLNLTDLQRIHPFVEEILITAAYVTFYEFNIDLSQWSRKAVEKIWWKIFWGISSMKFRFLIYCIEMLPIFMSI